MITKINQKYTRFLMQHTFLLVLVTTAILFQLAGPTTIVELRYERTSILSGQFWRMFSAHLVHLGWAHLSLNIVAFTMIWFFFRRQWQQHIWVVIFLFTSLGTSLGLLLFQPTLDWSVGLSGALHGLFAAGAIGALHSGYKPAIAVLVILVTKLIWEKISPMPGSEEWIGDLVITAAHLYGAIAGTIIALGLLFFNRVSLQCD